MKADDEEEEDPEKKKKKKKKTMKPETKKKKMKPEMKKGKEGNRADVYLYGLGGDAGRLQAIGGGRL